MRLSQVREGPGTLKTQGPHPFSRDHTFIEAPRANSLNPETPQWCLKPLQGWAGKKEGVL